MFRLDTSATITRMLLKAYGRLATMGEEMATTTRVVHVNDELPDAIYIGRAVPRRGLPASPWACSYRAGHQGFDRRAACARFARELLDGKRRHQLADLPCLRGRPLACWCRHADEPQEPWNLCHGDVLVEILDAYTDEQLRELAQQASAAEPHPMGRRA